MQYIEFLNIPSINNGSAPSSPVEIWGGSILEIIMGNASDVLSIDIFYSIDGAAEVLIDNVVLNSGQQDGTLNIEYYFNIPSAWDSTDVVFAVRVASTVSGDAVDIAAYDETYEMTAYPESYPKDLGPFPYVDIPRNADGSSDLSAGGVLYLTPEKYVTNNGNTTPSGSVYETKRLTLPVGYNNAGSAWYFDWMLMLKNEATANLYIRHYPELVIPNNIPYVPIIDDILSLMRDDYTDYPKCSHYVFYNDSDALDISRRIHMSSTGSITTILSRFDQKFAVQPVTTLTFSSNYTGTELNFSDTNSFHILAWLSGIDIQGRSEYVTYKIQSASGDTDSLVGNGIYFSVDGVNQELHLQIVNTTTYELTLDISDLFAEEPLRYHSFGVGFNNGDVLLYMDGRKVYRDLCLIDLPDISDGYQMLQLQGNHVAIDEFIISGGPLVDAEYDDIYQRSRVRMNNKYELSYLVYKYVQARVEFFAEGIREVEYHQFSMIKKENDIHHLPFDVDNRAFMSISQYASDNPITGDSGWTWELLIDLGDPNLVSVPVHKLEFELTPVATILDNTTITGSISGAMMGLDSIVNISTVGGIIYVTVDTVPHGHSMAGRGNVLRILFENTAEIANGSYDIVMSNAVAKDEHNNSLLITIHNPVLSINTELIVGTLYVDENGSAYTDELGNLYISDD